MFNRVGPSELAFRQQENMAANAAQTAASTAGRRPQTQENVGARGGRRQYIAAGKGRNMQKLTSATGKPLITSSNYAISYLGGEDQQNKSTQGGSNLRFASGGGRDHSEHGHLSQSINPDRTGGGIMPDHCSSPSPGRQPAKSQGKTATRIGRYQQKRKTLNGGERIHRNQLHSTLQLQEKLNMLNYVPPGAHKANRIRCSTRNTTHHPATRAVQSPRDYVMKQGFVLSQGEFQVRPEGGEMDLSNSRNHNTYLSSDRVTEEQLDSICISNRGDKEGMAQNKATIGGTLASLVSSQTNAQIISQGMSIEEPSTMQVKITHNSGNEATHGKAILSNRTGSFKKNQESPRPGNKKHSGGVLFQEFSLAERRNNPLDAVPGSVNSSDKNETLWINQQVSQEGALTQREKADPAFFDSVQSRVQNMQDAQQFASITVSDGLNMASPRTKDGLNSFQTSQDGYQHNYSTADDYFNRHEQKDEDEFQFLGRQLFSVQQELNKKAKKLYKGTVLIDRPRTRDLVAAKLGQNQKISANVKKLAQMKRTVKEQKQKQKAFEESQFNQMMNITSRHRETTVNDSEEGFVTDELLGSSGSQFVPMAGSQNTTHWLVQSWEEQQSVHNPNGKPPTDRQLTAAHPHLTQVDQFDEIKEEYHQRRPKTNQMRSGANKQSHRVARQTQPAGVTNRIYINKKPTSQERDTLNLVIGQSSIHQSDKDARVQRYMGELQKRAIVLEQEQLVEKQLKRKAKAGQKVVDVFFQVYNLLKEQNKEVWAAKRIQSFWRKQLVILHHEQYLKWLPINIDPENCDFNDVDRVLKVLDEYALKKLGVLENQPLLPQIVCIQRAARTYLVCSRLKRCVRDGIKLIRGIKAMQRFSDRAPQQNFFHNYDTIHGDAAFESLCIKRKQSERQRRIDAGENVSDTSSTKERKKVEKQELLDSIRRQSTVVQGFGVNDKRASMMPKSNRRSPNRKFSKIGSTILQNDERGAPPSIFSPQAQEMSIKLDGLVKGGVKSKTVQPTSQVGMTKNKSMGITPKQNIMRMKKQVSLLGQAAKKFQKELPAVQVDFRQFESAKEQKKQPGVEKKLSVLDSTKEIQEEKSNRAASSSPGSFDSSLAPSPSMRDAEPSMIKLRVMKPVMKPLPTTQLQKMGSVPPVLRENKVKMPSVIKRKQQSEMLAAAPIKSRSKRSGYPHRLGSSQSINARGQYLAGDNINSQETLNRQGGITALNSSYKTLAQVGGMRVSDRSSQGGLTVRTVRHHVDRECMWFQPDHEKSAWALKPRNKWRDQPSKPKKQKGKASDLDVSPLGLDEDENKQNEQDGSTLEGLSKKKMRQIRRKQFFAFFEGFFDKNPNHSEKMKAKNMNFTEQEKLDLLRKYFNKYFNEKLDVTKSSKEKTLEEAFNMSSTLQEESRTIPDAGLNYISDQHKDAFLGKSKGILGAYGKNKNVEKDLADALLERKHGKMRAAKVLIQTQFAPEKPSNEDIVGEVKLSQRSFHRLDDSTLSHRLSQIPADRAGTVLSTSLDGESKYGALLGGANGLRVPPNRVMNHITIHNQKSANNNRRKQSGAISPADLLPQNVSRQSSFSIQHSNTRRKSSNIARMAAAKNPSQKLTTLSSSKTQLSKRQSTAKTLGQSSPVKVGSPTAMERQKMAQAQLNYTSKNAHLDTAGELAENCMDHILEQQRLKNMQLKAQNAIITVDFSTHYSAYQDILAKYTPSAIFNGQKAKEVLNSETTAKEDMFGQQITDAGPSHFASCSTEKQNDYMKMQVKGTRFAFQQKSTHYD